MIETTLEIHIETQPSDMVEDSFTHAVCPKCYPEQAWTGWSVGDSYVGICGAPTVIMRVLDDPNTPPNDACPFCLELWGTQGPCNNGHYVGKL